MAESHGKSKSVLKAGRFSRSVALLGLMEFSTSVFKFHITEAEIIICWVFSGVMLNFFPFCKIDGGSFLKMLRGLFLCITGYLSQVLPGFTTSPTLMFNANVILTFSQAILCFYFKFLFLIIIRQRLKMIVWPQKKKMIYNTLDIRVGDNRICILEYILGMISRWMFVLYEAFLCLGAELAVVCITEEIHQHLLHTSVID